MPRMIQHLWSDDAGATMVEYGMILLFIAAVCVGAVALLGQSVVSFFASVPAGL